MDSLVGTNKDSDDSIVLESSPEKSRDASETDDSINLSVENCPVNQTIDIKDKEIFGAKDDNKSTNVDVVEEKFTQENPDSSNKEMVMEILAIKDDEDEKKDTSLLETNISSKLIDVVTPKIIVANKTTTSPIMEIKDAKRKRRTTSDQRDEGPNDDVETRAKRLKIKNMNDNYCWRCHKDSIDARCSACPRSWHRKCMSGSPPTSINETWICGECAGILRAENAETRSEIVAHMSVDHLCMLLKYIVERMRNCQGSEPFWKPVDTTEVHNYMDYIVRPMDLNLLESNVRAKLYGSTDAFMADAKWIQHNCIVFNTCGGVYADTSKLTNAAKQIIKTAKQEVGEIEACPDCYARGRNLPRPHHMWFIEACRRPHLLVWAKLKGFPFWPAKAMPRLNASGHVDVRFFGQHDRAWVSPKDCYLYSREPPAPLPRKRQIEVAECIKEITRHCRKLEIVFGPFQFAPPKTPYIPHDTMQIKIMLPQYDPLRPNDFTPSSGALNRRKSPFRKRNMLIKRKLETEASPTTTVMTTTTTMTTATTTSTTGESAVESSTKDSSILPKPESPTIVEKSNDLEIHETPVAETSRPKKRMRKSLNNSEIKSPMQDIEPSSPIQVIETSSTSTIDDTASKAETTISNGTTGTESIPIIKLANQSKLKNEKTVVPLEKSLAALLRKVNPKGRLSHPRNSTSKGTVSQGTLNTSKIEAKTSLIKVYKPKARMVDKVNAEKALKTGHEKIHDKSKDGEISKTIEAKMINGILTPAPLTTAANSGNPGNVGTTGNSSLVHTKRDNNIIITNSLLKMPAKKIQPRILVLNNGTLEPKPISSPKQQISSPKQQTSSPKMQTSTPKQQISSPKMQTSTPKQQTSTIKQQTSTPKQQTSSPKLQTSSPKHTSSSSEETRPRIKEPVSIRIKPEPQVSPPIYVPLSQKKPSRAKKSFPNKAPRLPQLLPKLPKPPSTTLDTMVYIPAQRNENGLDYQLPPPEAGPLSSQLNRSSNELMKRMAQLMEDAIKEAADSTANETGNTIESHQATIHSLRLQIERMRWQHQQQLAELKHNTDRTLREMRASLEAERLRAIEEIRKEADEDKARCIDDTKAKQWCSQCGREALFYCCWNTAYCDHLCQKSHWQSHQRKCVQKPSNVSNAPGDTVNKQQQKANDNGQGNSGTTEVSVSRSGFLSPIVKNIKIP